MKLKKTSSTLTRICLALAALSFVLCAAATAFGQTGPGVYYSYEKAQIGDTVQWVLIPSAMPKNLSEDLETNVRAAFKKLKKAKPPTYGSSSLNIDPKALAKGSVTVNVDKDKAAYALIIQAETVHTLATLGVTSVSFEGGGSGTLGVNDIPFVAFESVIPLWRALPPAVVSTGTVRLPNGDIVSADAFKDAIAKKDDAIVKQVFAAAKSKSAFARAGVIERLPGLKFDDWQDVAIKGLKDSDATVVVAAVTALTGVDTDEALDALVALVDKSGDETVKAAAAGALSASKKEKYSAYGLYYALRGTDAAAAKTALKEIRDRKLGTAKAEVVKALAHTDVSVGEAAADALFALEAFKELASALKDESLSATVRETAALHLGAAKDKDTALGGLAYLASLGSVRNASAAIQTLATFQDPEPFKAVASGLTHASPEVRALAASTLAGLGETDSLKPLSAAAEAYPEEVDVYEDAMVDLLVAAEKLGDLEDSLKKYKGRTKRVNFIALGEKAAKANRFGAVRDKLVDGVEDKSALIRGGAIRGLAKEKSAEALALVSSKVGDSDAGVRKDLARALGEFPAGEGTDAILTLMRDGTTSVAVAAIGSIAIRGEVAVYKDVLKVGKNGDTATKIAVIAAAPYLIDEKSQSDVLGHVSNALFDNEVEVKLAAIASLGELKDPQGISSLALLAQDPDNKIKHATLRALGVTQHNDALALLEKGLADELAETRIVALEAIETHGGLLARPAVEALVAAEKDEKVLAVANRVLSKLK